MTTIVLVKNKEFIFLGADTRRTFEYISSEGIVEEIKIEDGLKKIIKTQTGYIAGAGWEDLIFEVNKEVANLYNLEDISNKIIEIKNIFIKKYSTRRKSIEKTTWVLCHTYPSGKIEAFHFHPIENKLNKIQNKLFYLNFPNGDNKEIKEILSKEISEKLSKKNSKKLEKDKNEAFYCIYNVILSASSNSNYTSKDFHLAKLYKDKKNNKEEVIYDDNLKRNTI